MGGSTLGICESLPLQREDGGPVSGASVSTEGDILVTHWNFQPVGVGGVA